MVTLPFPFISTMQGDDLLLPSILTGQHQGITTEIEPDARCGEIGPLDLPGEEPVQLPAQLIKTEQHCIHRLNKRQLPWQS